MELSAEGLELIKTSEGFRSRIYPDLVGIPTIGYGHRVLPGESFPNGVGEAQATAILTNDVQEAEHAVTRLVTAVLTQGQFDALVDFCFNVGKGALAGSTLLKELNAGQTDAAAQQLLVWDHAGGVVVAWLKARRHAEFQLWTQGEAARQSASWGPTPPYEKAGL